MRPLFFLLLLANAIVLLLMQATQQFGSEPDRMTQQVNAERLNFVDVSGKSAASENSSASTAAKPACIEIGDFNTQTVACLLYQSAASPRITTLCAQSGSQRAHNKQL